MLGNADLYSSEVRGKLAFRLRFKMEFWHTHRKVWNKEDESVL